MHWAITALEALQEAIKEKQDAAIKEGKFELAEVLLDIREEALKRAIDRVEVKPEVPA